MRRAPRILAWAVLLAAIALGLYAYRAYDPCAPEALDRTEALPEGLGLAPRPAPDAPPFTVVTGRWMHDWIDPLIGLSEPKRTSANEVRILPEEARLEPPGSLRVRVRRVDGTASPGTPVRIYAPHNATAPAMKPTDARGEVAFDGLASAPGYVVEAAAGGTWHESRPTARVGVRVEAGVARDVEVALPGVRLEGQVVDVVTGDPVPHASVEAELAGPEDAQSDPRWLQFGTASTSGPLAVAIADGEGKFGIGPLAAGPTISLWARAGDGRLGMVGCALDGGAPPTLRIRVGRLPSANGTVVDEDGRGVAGARVRIATTRVEAPTDSAGRFTLDHVPAAFLVIEHEGATLSRVVTPLLFGEAQPKFRFPIRTAVLARVVDDSGGGLPNAVLHLFGVEVSASGEEQRYWVLARTDATGRARLAVLPGRVDQIRVAGTRGTTPFEADPDGDSPGSAARTLDLANPIRAGEVRDVVLTLRRGVRLRGRAVLPDGRPAAGAQVEALDPSAMLNDLRTVAGDDGRFRLVGIDPAVKGVEAPQMWVQVKLDGATVGKVDVSKPLPSAQDAEIDVGDVLVHPGAMLRGRVVHADGTLGIGARVQGNLPGPAAFTDAQGVYRLVVRPGERLNLEVWSPGTRARQVTVVGALSSGEVRDVEPIVLRRAPTVRVHVVDLFDRPVVGAQVRISGSPHDPRGATSRTDAQGWISLPPVGDSPPGLAHQDEDGLHVDLGALFENLRSQRIQVTLADGAVVERDLAMPETTPDPYEVVARVPARFALEGTVRDEAGRPVQGVAVRVSLDARWHGTRAPDDVARFPFAASRTKSDAVGHYRLPLAGAPGERWKVEGTLRDGRSAFGATVVDRDTSVDLALRKASEAETEGAGGK